MESVFLSQMIKKENESLIYSHEVLGIPFWRIVRFNTRIFFLNRKDGFTNNTVSKFTVYYIIKYFRVSFLSFVSFLKFVFDLKKVENVVYSFPRVQKYNGLYIDKFSDPPLIQTGLLDASIIFQRGYIHEKEDRINKEIIQNLDFVVLLKILMQFVLFPFVLLIWFKPVMAVFKEARSLYNIPYNFIVKYFMNLSGLVFEYGFSYLLLLYLKPQKIFCVNRENFFPQILAAKKLKINSYEFQHGVTLAETPLYSGKYSSKIDPDFFLVFGNVWIAPQFEIPLERIINIGWAYRELIEQNTIREKKSAKTVLFISSPEISSLIVTALITFSERYKDYSFHLRLHPQERLTKDDIDKLLKLSNVSIVDNSIESSIALLEYSLVLGENSSVLFEALSYRIKVGRVYMFGLNPSDGFFNEVFFKIDSFNAFDKMVLSEFTSVENEFYSDFDHVTFESLS